MVHLTRDSHLKSKLKFYAILPQTKKMHQVSQEAEKKKKNWQSN